jgi:flagellar motor switch protein FliN/FliY
MSEDKEKVDNGAVIPNAEPSHSQVEINPEEASIFNNNPNELLNEITMELTVEIGRAKIKISDLLNLSKGTIIHLDQHADEPLSIYANNKLIAKGHIISSNGKYSIRVI